MSPSPSTNRKLPPRDTLVLSREKEKESESWKIWRKGGGDEAEVQGKQLVVLSLYFSLLSLTSVALLT